jgi:RND superfamily putative drug exporter
MTTLVRFVLRHRRWVVLLWLAAMVAGGVSAQTVNNRLSYDFSLPGQPGTDTSAKIQRIWHTTGQSAPDLLVVSAPPGRRDDPAAAEATFAAVAKAVPQVRVIGYAQTRDPVFRTRDGRAEFAYAFVPPQTSLSSPVNTALTSALTAHAPPGAQARLTGLDVLGTNGDTKGPGVLAETLFGALGALVVLALVFGSLLALVPLLVAGVSILSTFLILLGLTSVTDVSFVVEFLVALIGLGVAIDYSLLLVSRWREERERGLDNDEAIVAAARRAGSAVVFSGLTVAVGLVALVVIPVPFLRSVGFGGMLIPLVSVAVVTTLLPVLLSMVGPRAEWPRRRAARPASRFWTAWAVVVVRRRWLAAGLATVILGLLAVPFFHIKIGTAEPDSLAHSGPAYEAWHALRDGGTPDGALTPMEVLTRAGDADTVATAVRHTAGVGTVLAPTGPTGRRDGMADLVAVPRQATSNSSSVAVVRAVKREVKSQPGAVGVTGIGATQLDYLHGVYGTFPYALAVIVVATYVMLARAFRSLLLPLKAVVLNLLSVAGTFGGVVLFWQYGYGSKAVFNVHSTGAITFWLPSMVFAFLFGLSMDYEVFILSRMREEYDRSGSTDRAVVASLGRTGRLVTSAALILCLAFLSLASGPQTDIKLFATALGFGILLDATVVRMLLLPALVSLLGRWNWWLPRWAGWLLRVPPTAPPAAPSAAVAEPEAVRVR